MPENIEYRAGAASRYSNVSMMALLVAMAIAACICLPGMAFADATDIAPDDTEDAAAATQLQNVQALDRDGKDLPEASIVVTKAATCEPDEAQEDEQAADVPDEMETAPSSDTSFEDGESGVDPQSGKAPETPAQDTADESVQRGEDDEPDSHEAADAVSGTGITQEDEPTDGTPETDDDTAQAGEGASGTQEAGELAAAIADLSIPAQQASKKKAKPVRLAITYAKASNAITRGAGKATKTAVVVKRGTTVLKEGVDYTLTFKNNKKTGTAKVVVRGIGAYKGKKTISFKIFGKPKYSGATWMPIGATAKWAVENAKLVLKSGKAIKLKGKTVTAVKKGTARLAVYDKLGKRVATPQVTVYRFADGVYLRLPGSKNLRMHAGTAGRGSFPVAAKAASADAQKFHPKRQADGTYVIQAQESGLVLQPKSASKKAGTPIVLANETGSAAQKWKVTVDAKNQLTFVNKKTKRAMGLAGAKVKAGAALAQEAKAAPTDAAKSQRWSVVVPTPLCAGASYLPEHATAAWDIANVKVRITAGKDVVKLKDGVLTALARGTARVVATDALGDTYLDEPVTVYRLSGQYLINTVKDAGKVVDVNCASMEDAGETILWWHNGLDCQKYTFAAQDDGTYTIQALHSGKYLQPFKGKGKSKTPIVQMPASGGAEQRWAITVDPANFLTFVNKKTGKAITLSGGSSKEYTPIVQVADKGKKHQKFTLVSMDVLERAYAANSDAGQRIAAAALALAGYGDANPPASRGQAKGNFQKPPDKSKDGDWTVFNQVHASLLAAGAIHSIQAHCTQAVKLAIKWAGVDDAMPSGRATTNKDYKYFVQSAKWDRVGGDNAYWHCRKNATSGFGDIGVVLRPGDILVSKACAKEGSTDGHYMIWLGEEFASKKYPGLGCNFYQGNFNTRKWPHVTKLMRTDDLIVFRRNTVDLNPALSRWASLLVTEKTKYL